MNIKNIHSFHVPVMGTGFSIDTPIKVAHYGISSVISLVDDTLIEEMRKFYCAKHEEPYTPITKYDEDFRARRITAYLDLVDRIVKKQFENLKNSPFEPGSEITKYFELLYDDSPLKLRYQAMLKAQSSEEKQILQIELRHAIKPGDINVNIMTKLDRMNYSQDGQELPSEYSDALSALRGYAQSTLTSAIVFSAGINRRLYSYIENFKDFYADATGFIKKKIILKVSDYRSSITQGKFLAKKGLWVSEYRVESGLNCGGHAFATDGFLMGPILEEFRIKRQELINGLHDVYNEALKLKNKIPFLSPHEIRITAQGGIGTAKENKFLLEHYQLDGTGWATPFLLVPEVTNVEEETLQKLVAAKENDLYLSDVSPLGVPFNNLRNSPSDLERDSRVEKSRPGSACPKGHLVSNTEFSKEPICTASRFYQKLKIEQLEKMDLSPSHFKSLFQKVVSKSCICNDLGEGVLIKNNINPAKKKVAAVCPGPNIAYFSKIATLAEMVNHIYGRTNLIDNTYRPHMFINELKMYVDYLKNEVKKCLPEPTTKEVQYLKEFKNNLFDGMEYYKTLFPQMLEETEEFRQKMSEELTRHKQILEELITTHRHLFLDSLTPAAVPV